MSRRRLALVNLEERMKILSPKIHGVLDYVVVAAFALSPTIFGLDGLPATISYVLAAVHLILTLLTASLGAAAVVPLTVHGWVELIVSVCLIALPFIAGFGDAARNFYIAAGVVIFIVWLITDYRTAKPSSI